MPSTSISRRQLLQTGLGIGCGLLIPGEAAAATIHELSGTVHINKRRASLDDDIRPGDVVSTSHTGRIAFSVAGDAFLLNESTSIRVGDSGNSLIDALHLFTGKLLSVFASGRRRRIVTATATMGIRGTACFLNVRPASTYVCTCYGQTELTTGGRRDAFEAIHHNPRLLEFRDGRLTAMREAGMQDHTDEQLRRLEAWVGRKPLFDVVGFGSG